MKSLLPVMSFDVLECFHLVPTPVLKKIAVGTRRNVFSEHRLTAMSRVITQYSVPGCPTGLLIECFGPSHTFVFVATALNSLAVAFLVWGCTGLQRIDLVHARALSGVASKNTGLCPIDDDPPSRPVASPSAVTGAEFSCNHGHMPCLLYCWLVPSFV